MQTQPGLCCLFHPRYICTWADVSPRRTLPGRSRSVLAPFPSQRHTRPRQRSEPLARWCWLLIWGGFRPFTGALLWVCPICRHRGGIWGAVAGDPGQGLQGHCHGHQQPRCALRLPAFTSTALSPAPRVSLPCLRTAGCFSSPGPYLLLICNCKQLFIIAHLQPLRPPCPPSAAPHCP